MMHKYIHTNIYDRHTHKMPFDSERCVGLIKLSVSFAKGPYTRESVLQKRPMIECISTRIFVCVRVFIALSFSSIHILIHVCIHVYGRLCVAANVCMCICIRAYLCLRKCMHSLRLYDTHVYTHYICAYTYVSYMHMYIRIIYVHIHIYDMYMLGSKNGLGMRN